MSRRIVRQLLFQATYLVCVLRRRILRRNDRYELAALEARLERDMAVGGGEKGVVLAHADVFTRIELGAALTHDHVAGVDDFAAIDLHAEHLRIRVATV